MKKTFIVFSIFAITAILFSSCKKDHICACTYDGPMGISQTTEHILENTSRSEAKDACLSYNFPGATNFDCKLK